MTDLLSRAEARLSRSDTRGWANIHQHKWANIHCHSQVGALPVIDPHEGIVGHGVADALGR